MLRAWQISKHLGVGAGAVNGCEPIGRVVASAVARRTGRPFVQEVHGRLLDMPEGYAWSKRVGARTVTTWLCRRARAVRAVSGEIGSSLVDAGVDPARISVIGQRCDTTR